MNRLAVTIQSGRCPTQKTSQPRLGPCWTPCWSSLLASRIAIQFIESAALNLLAGAQRVTRVHQEATLRSRRFPLVAAKPNECRPSDYRIASEEHSQTDSGSPRRIAGYSTFLGLNSVDSFRSRRPVVLSGIATCFAHVTFPATTDSLDAIDHDLHRCPGGWQAARMNCGIARFPHPAELNCFGQRDLLLLF